MPKVSVIMACHNSSRYLDEAIGSVLSQTLDDLELIVIDDYSIDNTLEIARRYQVEDDRVTVISMPKNSGCAVARNVGVRAARGEWLGILDSDDVAMPERFEEQMSLANNGQDLVLIGSDFISIDQNGLKIKAHKYPTDHETLAKRLESLGAFPAHPSIVYRRDMVEKLSGYNSRYNSAEDYDLWLRLSEAGKLASVDKPLVKYRRHEKNMSYLENGKLQIRLGVVATTCHFLRVHDYPDPSAGNDEETWQKFVAWIDERITKEGLYERREAWAYARKEYFAKANLLSGSFRFGTCLLLSGHAASLIWEKGFGSSLPKRLAQDWMKQAKVFTKT